MCTVEMFTTVYHQSVSPQMETKQVLCRWNLKARAQTFGAGLNIPEQGLTHMSDCLLPQYQAFSFLLGKHVHARKQRIKRQRFLQTVCTRAIKARKTFEFIFLLGMKSFCFTFSCPEHFPDICSLISSPLIVVIVATVHNFLKLNTHVPFLPHLADE